MDVSVPETKYPNIDQFFNSPTAPVVDKGLGWRGPMAEEYKMFEIILNNQQCKGSSDNGTGTGGMMEGWEF